MAKTKVSKPIPSVLPPYIVERDQIARLAGLSVEHSWGNYAYDFDRLQSIYRGRRAQLVASPFIEDKDGLRIPVSSKHCVKSGVAAFVNPGGWCLVGAFGAEDGSCFVKYSEDIPVKWGKLEHGTRYFVFEGGGPHARAVYRGTRHSLILDSIESEDGLAAYLAGDEPGTVGGRVERCGRWTLTLADYSVLDDGVIEVVKYPEAERQYQEHKEEGGIDAFASEVEFREHVQDTFELVSRVILNDLGGETQRRDVRFRFERLDVDAIAKRLNSVRELIDLGRIERHTRKTPPSTHAAPVAGSAAFERFMTKALGGRREK